MVFLLSSFFDQSLGRLDSLDVIEAARLAVKIVLTSVTRHGSDAVLGEDLLEGNFGLRGHFVSLFVLKSMTASVGSRHVSRRLLMLDEMIRESFDLLIDCRLVFRI